VQTIYVQTEKVGWAARESGLAGPRQTAIGQTDARPVRNWTPSRKAALRGL
jgi:hypothetical protein